MSIARPRFTSSRSMRVGTPSTTVNEEFIRGWSLRALTSAHAMTWVNDAFDCPCNARWLLMTRRFSSRALTGMLRTDVAVGTVSDVSMFATIFEAAPRNATGLWPGFGAAGAGTGVGRGGGVVWASRPT